MSWEPILNGPEGDPSTDIVGINMSFGTILGFQRTLGINLGEEVEQAGLVINGDADFDLDLSLDLLMNMSFNWDTDAFSFEIDHLTFQGHALIEDLVLGASFGPLEVAIGQAGPGNPKGVLGFDIGAQLSYSDGPGVQFTPTLNTGSVHNNFIDVNLPIFASLGGVSFGEEGAIPRVMLSGTLFAAAGGPPLQFTHENLDKIINFSDFNIGTLLAMIQGTLNWL